MKTLKEITEAFSQSLITDVRNDGTKFVKLADGSPEWMSDVVRTCHMEWFPDDKKYSMIAECASELSDRLQEGAENFDDVEYGEIADNLIDIYNYDRIKWLASHLERAYYCDDAQSEGIISADASMFDRLASGQYMEYSEILGIMMHELQRVFEDQE